MKKSDLRREIKKKSSSYTDEQLFGSDYYQVMLFPYAKDYTAFRIYMHIMIQIVILQHIQTET